MLDWVVLAGAIMCECHDDILRNGELASIVMRPTTEVVAVRNKLLNKFRPFFAIQDFTMDSYLPSGPTKKVDM